MTLKRFELGRLGGDEPKLPDKRTPSLPRATHGAYSYKRFLNECEDKKFPAGLSPAQKSAGADVIGVVIAASLSRLS